MQKAGTIQARIEYLIAQPQAATMTRTTQQNGADPEISNFNNTGR